MPESQIPQQIENLAIERLWKEALNHRAHTLGMLSPPLQYMIGENSPAICSHSHVWPFSSFLTHCGRSDISCSFQNWEHCETWLCSAPNRPPSQCDGNSPFIKFLNDLWTLCPHHTDQVGQKRLPHPDLHFMHQVRNQHAEVVEIGKCQCMCKCILDMCEITWLSGNNSHTSVTT
jgi:hypothetical protein